MEIAKRFLLVKSKLCNAAPGLGQRAGPTGQLTWRGQIFNVATLQLQACRHDTYEISRKPLRLQTTAKQFAFTIVLAQILTALSAFTCSAVHTSLRFPWIHLRAKIAGVQFSVVQCHAPGHNNLPGSLTDGLSPSVSSDLLTTATIFLRSSFSCACALVYMYWDSTFVPILFSFVEKGTNG